MSCEPDRLVLGISAETFWDGLQASRDLKKHLEERTKLPVSMGSEACAAAFQALGMKRIAVVTPYQPVGEGYLGRDHEPL
jgi:maleate isomerase